MRRYDFVSDFFCISVSCFWVLCEFGFWCTVLFVCKASLSAVNWHYMSWWWGKWIYVLGFWELRVLIVPVGGMSMHVDNSWSVWPLYIWCCWSCQHCFLLVLLNFQKWQGIVFFLNSLANHILCILLMCCCRMSFLCGHITETLSTYWYLQIGFGAHEL